MPTTFIKLDRSIRNWGWFTDGNTLKLWIYLLVKANIVPHDFMNAEVKRGELATSYNTLALETGMTVGKVRTALDHLKKCGSVSVKRYSTFLVITIKNYDLYQNVPHEENDNHLS